MGGHEGGVGAVPEVTRSLPHMVTVPVVFPAALIRPSCRFSVISQMWAELSLRYTIDVGNPMIVSDWT
jgi:hypothetical protein